MPTSSKLATLPLILILPVVGDVTLDNISVSDDLTDISGTTSMVLDTGPSFSSSNEGSPFGILKPNEIATFVGTYIIRQADVDAGGISNQVSATASSPADQVIYDLSDDDDDFEDPSDFEAPSKLEVTVDMTGSGLNRVPLSAIASQGIEPGSLLSNSGRVAPKMTKKAVKEKYKDIYQKLNSRTPMRGTGTEE